VHKTLHCAVMGWHSYGRGYVLGGKTMGGDMSRLAKMIGDLSRDVGGGLCY